MIEVLASVWSAATSVCSGVLGLTWLARRQASKPQSETVRIEPVLIETTQQNSPEVIPEAIPAVVKGPSAVPERDHYGRLKKVSPAKAAETLIKYLQTHKATGYYTAPEIDEAWEMCHTALALQPIPFGTIRSQLQAVPGVYIGRKQLAIEHPDIYRRTGNRRATLYYIPDKGQAKVILPSFDPTNLPSDEIADSHGIGTGQPAAKISVLDKKRHPKSNPKIRDMVWRMTDGTCTYCGVKLTTASMQPNAFVVEHIVAVEHGGKDHISNYVPACRTCNNRKGLKSAERYREELKNEKHKWWIHQDEERGVA